MEDDQHGAWPGRLLRKGEPIFLEADECFLIAQHREPLLVLPYESHYPSTVPLRLKLRAEQHFRALRLWLNDQPPSSAEASSDHFYPTLLSGRFGGAQRGAPAAGNSPSPCGCGSFRQRTPSPPGRSSSSDISPSESALLSTSSQMLATLDLVSSQSSEALRSGILEGRPTESFLSSSLSDLALNDPERSSGSQGRARNAYGPAIAPTSRPDSATSAPGESPMPMAASRARHSLADILDQACLPEKVAVSLFVKEDVSLSYVVRIVASPRLCGSLGRYSILAHLSLNGSTLTCTHVILLSRALAKLAPNLLTLNLSDNVIGNRGAAAIGRYLLCSAADTGRTSRRKGSLWDGGLQRLDLSQNVITKRGLAVMVRHIVLSRRGFLQRVARALTVLAGDGQDILVGLPACIERAIGPRLCHLELSGNPLEYRGAVILGQLVQPVECDALRTLVAGLPASRVPAFWRHLSTAMPGLFLGLRITLFQDDGVEYFMDHLASFHQNVTACDFCFPSAQIAPGYRLRRRMPAMLSPLRPACWIVPWLDLDISANGLSGEAGDRIAELLLSQQHNTQDIPLGQVTLLRRLGLIGNPLLAVNGLRSLCLAIAGGFPRPHGQFSIGRQTRSIGRKLQGLKIGQIPLPSAVAAQVCLSALFAPQVRLLQGVEGLPFSEVAAAVPPSGLNSAPRIGDIFLLQLAESELVASLVDWSKEMAAMAAASAGDRARRGRKAGGILAALAEPKTLCRRCCALVALSVQRDTAPFPPGFWQSGVSELAALDLGGLALDPEGVNALALGLLLRQDYHGSLASGLVDAMAQPPGLKFLSLRNCNVDPTSLKVALQALEAPAHGVGLLSPFPQLQLEMGLLLTLHQMKPFALSRGLLLPLEAGRDTQPLIEAKKTFQNFNAITAQLLLDPTLAAPASRRSLLCAALKEVAHRGAVADRLLPVFDWMAATWPDFPLVDRSAIASRGAGTSFLGHDLDFLDISENHFRNAEQFHAYHDVLTTLAHRLGSPAASFEDIFGFDPELLSMVPRPVYAVLLIYPITPEIEEFQTRLYAGKKADTSASVFFMQQTVENACGTVALFHSLLNGRKALPIEKESVLDIFYQKNKDLSVEERARAFELSDDIRDHHHDSAQEGETEIPEDNLTNHHYVVFVEHEGKLYELDGRREGPVLHGTTTESSLLEDACKVIDDIYFKNSEGSIEFSALALCKSSGDEA
ncbi:hypothetical protein H696_02086 [Fonticula alba]|uniref:Ubiquitin carboxyl-terminal hydrolase n=1 Tax=Fonticula alba TaxID=691883 RepID=A0A058ZA59_FONAL|nr:hypothetical protein H696_02086 [Fonticula alba]KCV71135.1 hypothetical protein H696_02086 [Fonticula alba]|eukprot:XP_009494258.1 hypothetical protein H696_02086 [Fonticula alba]